ncbi:MAG: 23S rRNA (pseudouridine(1915)-N(3))-methyltransferase RlmH [Bacteroidales bacterium]|nr:23S rRNA (pseudouridine(1915)-N(3))-methyltransferase RlmH [Bacteroidales bacterium]MCD8394096.1 23S rRNA (pseudouridine(1915)-N(3))-methyltransferase RlmH [Bacteroidales bacterium]
MKIVVMAVGKMATDWTARGVEEYSRRVGRYVPFELRVIPDIKSSKKLPEARQKELEGEAILAQVQGGDHVCLLDERGREMTSRELATWLDRMMVTLPKTLCLVIGGPYGFSDAVYARADSKMSLSRLTLPHELARLLLVEQLYRAMTILRGEPYHHD